MKKPPSVVLTHAIPLFHSNPGVLLSARVDGKRIRNQLLLLACYYQGPDLLVPTELWEACHYPSHTHKDMWKFREVM